MTQFHYMFLYADSLRVVNRVSQQLVQTLPLTMAPGSTCGLATDAASSTIYLFKGASRYLTGRICACISKLAPAGIQRMAMAVLCSDGMHHQAELDDTGDMSCS